MVFDFAENANFYYVYYPLSASWLRACYWCYIYQDSGIPYIYEVVILDRENTPYTLEF